MQPAILPRLYERLKGLPEWQTGEILNGQLHTHPRPAGPQALAESNLQIELGGPFDKRRGGPGGWWIIMEPELHFVVNMEVAVPDFAGWLAAAADAPRARGSPLCRRAGLGLRDPVAIHRAQGPRD